MAYQHYPPPPRRAGVSHGTFAGVSVALLFIGVVGGCTVGMVAADPSSGGAAPAATVTRTAAAEAGATTRPGTGGGPAAAKPKKTRKPPAIGGDGTFRVPQDVRPGTYRTGGDAAGNCYWARLRNLSGDLNAVLANGNVTGPTTVTIRRSDMGFQSQGCEEWRKVG